ncbi:hypothetical protein LB543_27695 [Mesorhizobium sp. ESP7-2]|uniref:hypothetical protein n=1 Tax=Mesorhizobium sp. ESP7-2 TaxID=2876622 RepID=UPI001CCE4882|nr:hypothetical protein [Mesorhizobium sp. ESP7-2]MBZ9710487.1 hypothetical protein [Mesorhizobium sp. ESP7-2]
MITLPANFDECFVLFIIADDGLSVDAEIYDGPKDGELVATVERVITSKVDLSVEDIGKRYNDLKLLVMVRLALENRLNQEAKQ